MLVFGSGAVGSAADVSAGRIAFDEATLVRTETLIPPDIKAERIDLQGVFDRVDIYAIDDRLELEAFRVDIESEDGLVGRYSGGPSLFEAPRFTFRSTGGTPFLFEGADLSGGGSFGSSAFLTGSLDGEVVFEERLNYAGFVGDRLADPTALALDVPVTLDELRGGTSSDYGSTAVLSNVRLSRAVPTDPDNGGGFAGSTPEAVATPVPTPAAAGLGLALLGGVVGCRSRESSRRRG